MTSSCISSCINDVVSAHLPTATSYSRLAGQSLVLAGESGRRFGRFEERCYRQLYLRSYTFCRKETFPDKTKRRIREAVGGGVRRRRLTETAAKKKFPARRRRRMIVCLRKVTCSWLIRFLRRLKMTCTTRVYTASD
ncbi:hypothetical protein LINPERPRIM_LOCUS19385 [Linum perenne]